MNDTIKERVKANAIGLEILAGLNIVDLVYTLANKDRFLSVTGMAEEGTSGTAMAIILGVLVVIYAALQLRVALGYTGIVNGKSKKTGVFTLNKVMLVLSVISIISLAYSFFTKSGEVTFLRGWLAFVETWTYAEFLFFDKQIKEAL